MSGSLSKFRKFLKRNETARGLLLVGIVILGALAVWGGIRLALNTEYPVLVVSSGSMCPSTNCVLPVGSLIVIRGQDPSSIVAGPPPIGSIIVFRPYPCEPDYLVVHRVITETNSSGVYYFQTKGDANSGPDNWANNCGGSSNTPMISGSQVVGVYQGTIPIPYLGSAILGIRNFMYDDSTGQPRPEGILVIIILIIALFAFEVIEPSKKPKSEAPQAEPNPAPTPTPTLPEPPNKDF